MTVTRFSGPAILSGLIALTCAGWLVWQHMIGFSLAFAGFGLLCILLGALPKSAFSDHQDIPAAIQSSPFDLQFPPKGAWFKPLPGGFSVGASTRRPVGELIMISVFASVTFATFLAFFPTRVSFVVLLFGLALLYVLALSAAGQIRLTQEKDRLTIFTGVGKIGSTLHYPWSSFRSVQEDGTPGTFRIVLEGAVRAQFGGQLSDQRRRYILNVLRTVLPAQTSKQHAEAPIAKPSELTHGNSRLEIMQRTCSFCGALRPASAYFCTVCGKQAATDPRPLEPASFEDDWSVPLELLLPVPRPVRGIRITLGQRIVGIVLMAGMAVLAIWAREFLLPVALCAWWVYHISSQHRRLLKWGKPARAVVAEMIPVYSPRFRSYYSTLFEYQDDTGHRLSSRQDLSVPFMVGRVMTVLYDPKKPSSCVMYPMESLEIVKPKNS